MYAYIFQAIFPNTEIVQEFIIFACVLYILAQAITYIYCRR